MVSTSAKTENKREKLDWCILDSMGCKKAKWGRSLVSWTKVSMVFKRLTKGHLTLESKKVK